MTVSNHIAAIVAIVVGAYASHLWWPEIRHSLGLLVTKQFMGNTTDDLPSNFDD